MGLVALRHVGSSQTRAQTRVPCIGGQTLNHCATREAPLRLFFKLFFFLLNLQNPVCLLHLPFGQAAFQVPKSHMWLLWLESSALDCKLHESWDHDCTRRYYFQGLACHGD